MHLNDFKQKHDTIKRAHLHIFVWEQTFGNKYLATGLFQRELENQAHELLDTIGIAW